MLQPNDLIRRPRTTAPAAPQRRLTPHRIGTPQAVYQWVIGQATSWYSTRETR